MWHCIWYLWKGGRYLFLLIMTHSTEYSIPSIDLACVYLIWRPDWPMRLLSPSYSGRRQRSARVQRNGNVFACNCSWGAAKNMSCWRPWSSWCWRRSFSCTLTWRRAPACPSSAGSFSLGTPPNVPGASSLIIWDTWASVEVWNRWVRQWSFRKPKNPDLPRSCKARR